MYPANHLNKEKNENWQVSLELGLSRLFFRTLRTNSQFLPFQLKGNQGVVMN